MTKHEVLDRINEIIDDEKGREVTLDSMFADAELDSLGAMITLATIDAEFEILDKDDEHALKKLDVPNLTIRDLVVKCILSTTSTSKPQSNEMDT